ncbi:MAG TPA: DUF969 family protein, partial [Blastocatellia bacterium]|nr:DUF969 family protein [Blastocatellia bacterium]
TLPAIGLAERYGLQEQSAILIGRFRAATVGRLQSIYQLFRVLQGLMGIRLNGHAPFVRPLLFPMSAGAARQSLGDRGRDPEIVERIKAANGAAENYANFYGQNLSPVQAGVLMVFGVMQGLGYSVSVWRLVLFTIPVATAAVVIGRLQFYWFDLSLKKQAEGKQ